MINSSDDTIRILHVDDDTCTLEVSKQILQDMGNFEIQSACCVDEAIKKLEVDRFDVVVSDYDMPQKDGLQFLKELRDQKINIPFVLFTGKGREEVAIKALNLGADGYYNKQGSTETVYGELAFGIRLVVSRRKAQETLKKSEDKYHELINGMNDTAWVIDFDAKFIDVNKTATKTLGYSREELLSMGPSDIDGSLSQEEISRLVKNMPADQVQVFETTHKTKDGRQIPVEISSSLVTYQGKQAVLSIARDITERQKNRKRLQESEEQFRQFFSNLPSAVAIYEVVDDGEDFIFRDFNSAAEKIENIDKTQLLGKRVTEVFPRVKDFGLFEVFQRVWKTGKTEYFPISRYTDQRDPGSWRENRVIRLPSGSIAAIYNDVTEFNRLEQALKESIERFRQVSENAQEWIWEVDPTGLYVYSSPVVEKLLGYKPEEIVGKKHFYDLFPVDEREELKKDALQTFAQKSPFSGFLNRNTHKNGNVVWLSTSGVPILDTKDNLLGYRGLDIDVTYRKEAEEKLIESEKKYRDIFDNARDAIYTHDLKGKIIEINKVVEEYGFTCEQIIGKNILKFVPKKYWLKIISQISQISQGKRVEGEIEINTPMGKRITEYRSNPIIRGEKVVAVHSIMRDITDRKSTENALLESQQTFSALFASNPEAAVFLDNDFNVIEANPRFIKLFGYSIDEIKNKDLIDFIVPDDSKQESKIIRQKIRSGAVEIITSRKGKDGSEIPLLLTASQVFFRDKTIGAIFVFKNISEIITVQEELSKTLSRTQLLNEKLKVVGSLTRHDVGNKISTISGHSFILKKKYADKSDIIEFLDKIEQAIRDSIKIFDFSQTYEKLGVEDLVEIDVGRIVSEVEVSFSGLTFKVINDCDGLVVKADSLLKQLIYNFIDNTRKYGEKTTAVRIHYKKNVRGEIQLIYEDDGAGIRPENKVHLFKQGFSTGGSTGFGLFLCKKMIEAYGWTITETGVYGKGARFEITIPGGLE